MQVYLDPPEQERLERLTAELDTTKSDVLRRGLEALERELFDPERHPALQIIGIAGVEQGREGDFDVAREHDRFLAGLEDRRLLGQGVRWRLSCLWTPALGIRSQCRIIPTTGPLRTH